MRKLLVLVIAAFAACDDGGGIVTIDDDTGTVQAVAFLDIDGDGVVDTGEGPVAGVRVGLLRAQGQDTIAAATTGANGVALLTRIPLGGYRLVAGTGTIGDSLVVLPSETATLSVTLGDTVQRSIRVGYPSVQLAAARSLPEGRRVVIEGIALNGRAAFGDSTIHLLDASGAARLVRTSATAAQAGDSIRAIAVTGTQAGRFVLTGALVQVIEAVGVPAPDSLSTAHAAMGTDHADGQVRVAGALIVDSATVNGDRVLTVDDGSGPLDVVLDRHIQFGSGAWVPGAMFDGAGVLVPASGDAWQLKPRTQQEASASFPTVTTAQVRTLAPGQRVAVEGIALNSRSAFGDTTVHVSDSAGAVRLVRVVTNVTAGDSLRFVGTIAERSGQRVLSDVTASTLRAGAGVPAPDSVATSAVGSAQGGARDAHQVRIAGVIAGVQPQANGDRLLLVDDGSGMAGVLLDAQINFGNQPFQPNAELRAAGVLVPTGSGTWQLKPRAAADAAATQPTVSIATARALPAGRIVYVVGVALNSRVTFADGSVHLGDPSATLRVTGVPIAAGVLQGDSIRVLGTITAANGQPILAATSVTTLLAGVGMPAADSISTAAAADAANGTRDAGQARVRGSVSAVTPVAGGTRVTINDGSGDLIVSLETAVGVFPAITAGNVIRVTGVLLAESGGDSWVLRPRTPAELSVLP